MQNVALLVTGEMNIKTTIGQELLLEDLTSRAVAEQLPDGKDCFRKTEPARHYLFQQNRKKRLVRGICG
jgi:hypothetical protein